jgi:hypothetical protein
MGDLGFSGFGTDLQYFPAPTPIWRPGGYPVYVPGTWSQPDLNAWGSQGGNPFGGLFGGNSYLQGLLQQLQQLQQQQQQPAGTTPQWTPFFTGPDTGAGGA